MAAIIASRTPRNPARAEPVGSLVRNPHIAEQYDRIYEDETTALRGPVIRRRPGEVAELNRRADEAIDQLVRRQIDSGLDVVTDGEMRRATFLGSLYDAVEGMTAAPERTVTRDESGALQHEWLADPMVDERLRKIYSPAAEEATYMRTVTDFPFKITLPRALVLLRRSRSDPRVGVYRQAGTRGGRRGDRKAVGGRGPGPGRSRAVAQARADRPGGGAGLGRELGSDDHKWRGAE